MNISVSEELHSYIVERAEKTLSGTVSEYIRTLVRKEKEEMAKPKPPVSLRTANECIEAVIRAERVERAAREFFENHPEL